MPDGCGFLSYKAVGAAASVSDGEEGYLPVLSSRILVMKEGEVVESGLTDRVLDDPQAPYTQLLVSSVLAA